MQYPGSVVPLAMFILFHWKAISGWDGWDIYYITEWDYSKSTASGAKKRLEQYSLVDFLTRCE